MCMMVAVLFAMRNAIDSARKDAGNTDWYQMGTRARMQNCSMSILYRLVIIFLYLRWSYYTGGYYATGFN